MSPTVHGEPRTGDLLIGWSSVSITPDKPVALSGQFHMRISESVHDPVTATALAIEVKDAAGVVDQAIIVSCDLVAIRTGIQQKVRDRLAGKLKDFDLTKLFLTATHTHTGPILENFWPAPPGVPDAKPRPKHPLPKQGVTQVDDYLTFLVDRVAEAITAAWNGRKPAGVSSALSHAVVGHNRRVVYEGGEARMYGRADTPEFRNIEGSEDHGVELLFAWDPDHELTGIVINIACPSQVVESKEYLSADFWHDVREVLRERHAKDLFVLPLCGAAGDQSPHPILRKRAEATLRERKGISETREVGLRVARAVDAILEGAKKTIRTSVPFEHKVEELRLPGRVVSEQEAQRSKARVDAYKEKGLDTLTESHLARLGFEQDVIARYEHQSPPDYSMELHVLRLGDVAIATNPFELFLDFGLRIKACSRAEQTLIAQLSCDCGWYLPTAKAVRAGGYGAEPPSNLVGPRGGQLLVERTVAVINEMFAPDK